MASSSRGGVEGARLDLDPRGGQRQPRPARRVEGQRRGPLQECGRCAPGRRGPGARPADAFQLRGDVFVRPGRGLRPVPGPAVGIDPRIGDLRQRAVHLLLFPGRRRPVDHRADQRVAEPHPGAELGQAGLGHRRGRFGADARARWPRARPAPGRQSGRPRPATAAAGPGRESVAPGGGSSPRRCPASGTAPGSPNPPASSAGVSPRGSSSKASGLPRVSATI